MIKNEGTISLMHKECTFYVHNDIYQQCDGAAM